MCSCSFIFRGKFTLSLINSDYLLMVVMNNQFRNWETDENEISLDFFLSNLTFHLKKKIKNKQIYNQTFLLCFWIKPVHFIIFANIHFLGLCENNFRNIFKSNSFCIVEFLLKFESCKKLGNIYFNMKF